MENHFDVFKVHEQIINDYSDYVQSFLTIADDEIERFVEDQVIKDRSLWPDALIQYGCDVRHQRRHRARVNGAERRDPGGVWFTASWGISGEKSS
ncbi:MAG: hypothetical protein ACK2UT_08745, partial [Candidatus Promineifilaceae bacterium]